MLKSLAVSIVLGAILLSSAFARADEHSTACCSYDCCDCSCIANNPKIKDRLPEFLSKVHALLEAYGIPGQAVNIGVLGQQDSEIHTGTTLSPFISKCKWVCKDFGCGFEWRF